MREINMDRAAYLKALRNQNPMDHFSDSKSTVNRIGRITARVLNNNPDFQEALRQSSSSNLAKARAGNMFHNTADRVTKLMVERGKIPAGIQMSSEHTIRFGKAGSRADNLSRDEASNTLSEIDYKTDAKGALRSKGQMEKHANHLEQEGHGRPAVQEARNWTDFVREVARNAAKFLPKPNAPKANAAKRGAGNSQAAKPAATPGNMRHSASGGVVPAKPGSTPKGTMASTSAAPSPPATNTPKNTPGSGPSAA